MTRLGLGISTLCGLALWACTPAPELTSVTVRSGETVPVCVGRDVSEDVFGYFDIASLDSLQLESLLNRQVSREESRRTGKDMMWLWKVEKDSKPTFNGSEDLRRRCRFDLSNTVEYKISYGKSGRLGQFENRYRIYVRDGRIVYVDVHTR